MALDEKKLVQKVIAGKRRAQKKLYQHFAPAMYPVALRYAQNRSEADDILQEAFVKVFEKLHTFAFTGPLGAWIRRIVVHTAINYYKQQAKHNQYSADFDTLLVFAAQTDEPTVYEQLSAKELIEQIQGLPQGYRQVFNMYVIEGYSHKDIALILDISENTSKSQLSRARALLRQKIDTLYNNE